MNSNYSNIATLNASLQEHIIKSDTSYREKKLHVGWLGVVFGSGENSPINIAGITAFLSLLAGFVISGILIYAKSTDPFDVWKVLSPIITGALGFIFGRDKKENT